MSPGGSEDGIASVQPRPAAHTHSQGSYLMGCCSRVPFWTHVQQKSATTRAPLRKGHFVLYILKENRADNSEWGEAKHRLSPGRHRANQGGTWFSFLPFQSLYDL